MEELLEKINKELGVWENYYNMVDEISLQKMKEVTEDKKYNDEYKAQQINIINEQKQFMKQECLVAMRTLTWIKEEIDKCQTTIKETQKENEAE